MQKKPIKYAYADKKKVMFFPLHRVLERKEGRKEEMFSNPMMNGGQPQRLPMVSSIPNLYKFWNVTMDYLLSFILI